MFTAFSTALSALQADSSAIDVVGNNLANLNTTGYKSTEAEFESLMSTTLGTASANTNLGMGVGQLLTEGQYTQGSLTSTNGPTDAALQGNGFFVVTNSSNQTLYTRDGAFQVNAQGQLVTATGEFVQGWSALNGAVNPNGPTGNLSIPLGTVSPATPTGNVSMKVNLNAAAATGASSAFSAPVQVYDSLGTAHTLTITYQKTGNNSWSYTVTVPQADVHGNPQIATGTMTFNGSGVLTSPTAPVALSISGLTDGASNMSINWNLFDSSGNPQISQYSETSALGATSQDGAAAGQIASVSLQNGGMVVATYSNGQQATIGQIAVASIPNPDSLVSAGNNELATTAQTGAITLGAAGTAGRGQIVAGSLESSNADMATEFTHLLSYERSYQAASRVITTSDQLLQETVNLIHS